MYRVWNSAIALTTSPSARKLLQDRLGYDERTPSRDKEGGHEKGRRTDCRCGRRYRRRVRWRRRRTADYR